VIDVVCAAVVKEAVVVVEENCVSVSEVEPGSVLYICKSSTQILYGEYVSVKS
jgi:hypothetical protein